MSVPISAQGTQLQVGDGAEPEVFTPVARVTDISGPGLIAEVEDVTSHDTSGWRERLSTILDAGEITFDIFYIPNNPTHNQTTGLLQLYLNRLLTNFRLVMTDAAATTYNFSGYVTSFETSAPIAAAYRASITITITGAVTITST